ncbi:hypothetical protein JST97_14045 [bacterium]|nr:hypothetical protein [bacterium]
MRPSSEAIDLDYDSPLENLFWFLGSPWCMGMVFFGTWIAMVSRGKNGAPPVWPDFPVLPFFLTMLCIWAIGFWLKANYDVRYHLDPKTQQLALVRTIFGQLFKTRIADFSQLHSAAVLTSWSDDKQGKRSWQYALCLVTHSARIVRVSSYSSMAPDERASEIARKLGIQYFTRASSGGTLQVSRGPNGSLSLFYNPPPTLAKSTQVSGEITLRGLLLALGVVIVAMVMIGFAISYS